MQTHGKATALHRRRPQEAAGRGREAGPRRRHHARADRPQRHHRQDRSAARPSPRTASPSARKSTCPIPFENMGAKLVNAVAQKTSDVAGDGTTTATILALSIYQEGLRNITAGGQPDGRQARHRQGRRQAAVEHLETSMSKKLTKKEEMAAGRRHQRQQRPDDRQADGRRLREGRQGRRHHRRGRQDLRDDARVRRGHAVRQGLHLAVLRRSTRRR